MGAAFSDDVRASIADALIADAFALIERLPELRWWVVSDGPMVLERAAALGAETVADPGDDLNLALTRAIEAAEAAGADAVVIIPGDIPVVAERDVAEILEVGETSQVVVVPSNDGGTNGLYLRPPSIMQPEFGPGSLQAHVERADALGLRCTVLPLESMATDLDTEADAAILLAGERKRGSATLSLLEGLGR